MAGKEDSPRLLRAGDSAEIQLTDEQQAIVTADLEHCIITAVAGSGKTTTLAWRIRHLLAQGQDATRMRVLMFNRAACEDFQHTLTRICATQPGPLPQVLTYHALGLRLYQRFARDGYLPPFVAEPLRDSEIQQQLWQLIRRLAPESLQGELKRSKKEAIETAVRFIDQVKSALVPAEQVFERLDYASRYRYLTEVFHAFEQWRKTHHRISYADMLYEPVMAIHQQPALQRLVADKLDLLLVDEYQDTNEIQHLLLRYIAGERAKVTVVGDPDQTIYEFRGARPEFILRRFSEEFDRPREYSLSYSFRYGHRVALLANHLISHNTGRKGIYSRADAANPDTQVHLHVAEDDARQITQILHADPAAALHSAVLCRVWSQALPLELSLLAHQIPYRIEEGKGALRNRDVQTLWLLFRWLDHQLDQAPEAERLHAAQALLRFPHVGLPEAQLQSLAAHMAASDQAWHWLLQQADLPDAASHAWTPYAARNVRQLGKALQQLAGFRGRVEQLVDRYAEATQLYEGLRSLAMTHEAGEERVAVVSGFRQYLASLKCDLQGALVHLAQLLSRSQLPAGEGVLLTSIHRSKGRQWPQVLIPGLQDRLLPYTLRSNQPDAALIESERRLLYVAMTRSQQHLHLLTRPAPDQATAQTRPASPDQTSATQASVAESAAAQSPGSVANLPSRFVDELQFDLSDALGQLIRAHQAAGHGETPARLNHPATPVALQYAQAAGLAVSFSHALPAWPEKNDWASAPVGTRVHHRMLGVGRMVARDTHAFEVRFDTGDQRRFISEAWRQYFVETN